MRIFHRLGQKLGLIRHAMTIVTQHSNRCGTGTIILGRQKSLKQRYIDAVVPPRHPQCLKQMMLVALVRRIK